MLIKLELTIFTDEQVISGLFYIYKKLGLAYGALNYNTILLNVNGRVKIGKFGRLGAGGY